ncbi:MAG TPA: hypothetical protein VFH12_08910 [Pseudoxanthomonas sp.]|nr:hypothetical protein [Pseudoxanthomonas sp.]
MTSAVACKRDEPVAEPQPAAVATPAVAPEANPVDATSVVDNTPAAEAATVDSKAIAGSFTDGESVLELRADGSYVQTLNAGGSSISSDGTWSGKGGKGLLLDPSSKSAEDVSFEIVSNDELRTDKGMRVFRRVAGR